jgi:glutamate racemase
MIGIFDSGMGGLTVLEKAIEFLPNEDFVYFGDSKNAPYGIKSKEKVIDLSDKICKIFIKEYHVDAIVIACNTATSAAAEILREKYNIPIIGMEPAIKPAIENNNGGNIIVLATEMTLKEKKFNDLIKKFNYDNIIIKKPCTKLVKLIENIEFDKSMLNLIIDDCLENIENIESIVLGCTHFVFIKDFLEKKFNNNIKIYDGNDGTILNLKKILENNGLLNNNNYKGKIIIINSAEKEILEKSKKLFDDYIKGSLYE